MRGVTYPFLYLASYLGSKTVGLDFTISAFRKVGHWQSKLAPMKTRRSLEALSGDLKKGYSLLILPVQCLDQAIVTWYVLNLHGHASRLKIGVQLHPVGSHAWVEAGDAIFGDIATREDMHVTAEYPPWGE